jgi:hypothetical protein
MLIAIDHGNSSTKTKHDDFPSGFVRNPSMPQMASDWIDFNGSTYVLYAPSFFVGGGSQLLKPMLEQSDRLKKAAFITDTLDNAKDYAAMVSALFGEGQGQKNEQKI